MRRGYRCVSFLAVLFACIPISSCGGGGTAHLLVTTTSLPDGFVGSPYSATLVATGGTPSYTWTQVSGGAMPSGISLGSAGVFNGTPTVAGQFGPYVFKATDSTGLVASSTGLAITIHSTPLSVTTSALAGGTVNAPYSFALAATGGTAPYTWAETSGGAFPPGLGNITSAGLIAGTPTMAGSFGPYVFTVTDSTHATAASLPLTLTIVPAVTASCEPLGNEAALSSASPYAFLVEGTDGNGNPIDIAGSFTPNGAGGITSATVDYNGFTNGPVQMTINLASSSYAFGPSTLGCLYLAFSDPIGSAQSVKNARSSPRLEGPAAVRSTGSKQRAAATDALPVVANVKFSFSLSGFDGTLYHTGRIIESDTIESGTKASGSMGLQVPSAYSLASLEPNYAFGLDGWTADSTGQSRTVIAGTFANSSGQLSSGFADLNKGGTPTGELSGGSGTLNSSIDPSTGRGTGTYTVPVTGGNLTFDFAFYILNGSDFLLLSTDSPSKAGSPPLLAGRVLASNPSYAPGAVNGYYIVASQGLAASGSNTANTVEIGTFNAAAGAIPSGVVYLNHAGNYSATPYFNGSYTLEAASGRVAISGLGPVNPVVYLTASSTGDDEIAGFLVGADSAASSGFVVEQSATSPAYLTSDISGNYAMSTQEDLDGRNGTSGGAFSFSGSGQYTSTQITTGSVPNLPPSGVISVNSDGSGSLNGGNFPLVTNGEVILAIPKSSDPLLYVFSPGTLPN